jgi:hypothetical protein
MPSMQNCARVSLLKRKENEKMIIARKSLLTRIASYKSRCGAVAVG